VTSAQIGIGKPGIVGNTASDLTFEGNTAAGMLDAALVNQIYAEGLYINVATAAHPAGEIRGQVASANPLGGHELAFSRAISGRGADFTADGFTNLDGQTVVDIVSHSRRRDASGYYQARLTNTATNMVVAQWYGIPINGGQSIDLRAAVGGRAIIEGSPFGRPIAAAKPVAQVNESLPVTNALFQNYPNPFNPSTHIRFDLQTAEQVLLTVYNTAGQEVAQLVEGHRPAGQYRVTWNASGMASGSYFYRLKTNVTEIRRKVLF